MELKHPESLVLSRLRVKVLRNIRLCVWISLSLRWKRICLQCRPGSGGSPGEGNGYHSNILAWRISWTVCRVRHHWGTFTFTTASSSSSMADKPLHRKKQEPYTEHGDRLQGSFSASSSRLISLFLPTWHIIWWSVSPPLGLSWVHSSIYQEQVPVDTNK